MNFKLLLGLTLSLYTVMVYGGDVNSRAKLKEEVVSHYSKEGDKEKIEAAHFLIDNMQYHYSKSSPLLDRYYEGIARVNEKYSYPECIAEYEKLYSELGFNTNDITLVCDADVMDAPTIIHQIDMAFELWREGLWSRHLTFEEFCEYLLPYRIVNEKITPNWREEMQSIYMKNATSIMNSDDMRYSAYWAASKLSDALRKLKFHNKKVLPQLNTDFPLSALKGMRMGECRDYAIFTAYAMRACGIPVSVDFTPQWPDRALNHHWNVLHDNTGMPMSFMGCESNPGSTDKAGRLMAKVYRLTFAYQPNSLFALNENLGERVPRVLNNPFMKDVSHEYFKGRNLTLAIDNSRRKDKFAYIAVFNNAEWIPVDYAVIDSNSTVTFRNLGSDIVYLPVFWGRNGSVPAGNPILLSLGKEPIELNADHTKLQTITINRKYPQFNRISKFRGMMKGGYFEASNSPDFSDAVKCVTIKKTPQVGYDTLDISKIKGKYRYWRYVAQEKGKCNAAEIKFISGAETLMPLSVLAEGEALDDTKAENVFDGNELTYYSTRTPENAWVGADMGKPVRVDRIAYLPRNDDNDVVAGQQYELSYFENGRQRSAGIQRATNSSLTFENVPSSTLYILHNLGKGREERIFTYENNKIHWY